MHTDCIDGALYAVILVVFCRKTKRFLFLTELTSKPRVFKKKGMLALPSETKEESDSSVKATVYRLIREEIGVSINDDITLLLKPLVHFKHRIPVYVAWVAVDEEFEAVPADIDVEQGHWLSKREVASYGAFADFFRIETDDVLELFKNESALS